MSSFQIRGNPKQSQYFGKNQYAFAGCMKFSIRDKSLEKRILKKSKKFMEYSPKLILKASKQKGKNICTLCENYGSNACPFLQSEIDERFLEYQSHKQKCSLCQNKLKNFHAYIFSPKEPELVCLTCYQAMTKGVYFQYIKKVYLRINTLMFAQLPLSLIALFSMIGGISWMVGRISPLGMAIASIIGLFLAVGGVSSVLIIDWRKRYVAKVSRAIEPYGYHEFDTKKYSLKNLIQLIVNPKPSF